MADAARIAATRFARSAVAGHYDAVLREALA
jgi:hypothetical protein